MEPESDSKTPVREEPLTKEGNMTMQRPARTSARFALKLLLPPVLAVLVLGSGGPESLLQRIGVWPGFGRGPAMDAAVSGNYAYVAAGPGGVLVVDVSRPAQPVQVGGYWAGGTTPRVQVEGSRAYIARNIQGGSGCNTYWRGLLEVLDLADPVHPKLLGSFTTGQEIRDLQIVGARAYLAGRGGGMQVVDVSNPARPLGLGSRIGFGVANALNVRSNRLCVLGNNGSSLYLADASTPPQGDWSLTLDLTNSARTVWLQGDYAYVADSDGLSVFDLNPPASCVAHLSTEHGLLGLQLAGTYLYAAAAETGLVTFDMSNPLAPIRVGACATPGCATRLALNGNYAYVAAHDGGLQIINISNPAGVLTGTLDTGLTTRQTQVAGDKACVFSSDKQEFGVAGTSRLELLSITNAAQPALLGVYQAPGVIQAYAFNGNLACLLWTDGVDVVDWRNPAQPQRVSTVPIAYGPDAPEDYRPTICLVGSNAFVGTYGLQVISLQDPAQPRSLATNNCGWVSGFRASGNYLFLVTDNGGLIEFIILDATNPAQPVRRGSYALPNGGPYNIVLAGNTAHVQQSHSVTLLDISDPSTPSPVGTYSASQDVFGLAADDHYAFLAEGAIGLEILDVSDPAHPQPVPGWSEGSSANGVLAAGGRVYVADAGLGLVVLQPRPDLVILNPPQDQTLTAGQSATLQVQAIGPAPLQFQSYWGQSGDTAHPSAGATAASFTSPALTQTAALWVRVTSGGHSVDSSTARLAVAPALALELLGSWPGYRMGPANAVEVSGAYAYVAAGSGGLMVFDVSDPAAPRRLGSWQNGDSATDVALSGQYAFLAASQSLNVLDVGQPSQPVVVGNYSCSNSLWGLAAVANYVCLLELSYPQTGGVATRLEVMDSRKPASPRPVGSYESPFSGDAYWPHLSGVAVAGGYAYVVGWWQEYVGGNVGYASRTRLEVIDLSNPAHPLGRGLYSSADETFNGIGVAGHYAYVTVANDQSNGQVVVFDVSNPAQPQRLTAFASPTMNWWRGSQVRPTIAGTYLYLPWNGLVELFDVTNPVQPIRLGAYQSAGSPQGVKVAGGLAYVAAGDAGLEVVAVSNPAQPQRLGSFDTSRSLSRVFATPAYVLAPCQDQGFEVIDTANPCGLRLMGEHDTGSSGSGPVPVFAAGSAAYVGAEVFDLSNPAAPVRVGEFANGPPAGITVSGDYACVAGQGWSVVGSGLQVFDVSNPFQPFRLGGYTGGSADAVAVWNNYAYVAFCDDQNLAGNSADGLAVFDLSSPATPVRIGFSYAQGGVQAITITNQFAYLAIGTAGDAGNGGLEILDLGDPAQPARVSRTLAGMDARRVCVAGHYAYVLLPEALAVVDVSDPTLPIPVAQYAAPEASDVAVYGDTIYLADGTYGLAALRLRLNAELAQPARVGNGVRLVWSGAPGVTLQRTASLQPAQWQDVPGSEGASQLDLPLDTAAGFFRLRY